MRGKLVFSPPKANKVRTIPLPGSIRDVLAAHLAQHPAAVVNQPWPEPGGPQVGVPLISRGARGSALNRNSVNHYVWKPALRSVGIEATRANGMHALRHHYASVLLDAGESIKAVSEYLGHSDAGFTLRVYMHLMPSSAERTRLAVDDALGCYISATSSPITGVANASDQQV